MKRWKHVFKKGMAFVLSLAMVAGLVLAMSGGAQGCGNVSYPVARTSGSCTG